MQNHQSLARDTVFDPDCTCNSNHKLTGDRRAEERGKRQRQVNDGNLLDGKTDALHMNGQVGQQR